MTGRAQDQHGLDMQAVVELAVCVDAIGTESFAEQISLFCLRSSGADTVFLCAFFGDTRPVSIFSNHLLEEERQAIATYIEAAYLLDPFYLRFKQKCSDEVMRIEDLAPDNFRRSEYYQKFYKDMHIRDECGVMVRISNDAALFLSLGLSRKRKSLNTGKLRIVLPLVSSMARRHWTVLSPGNAHGTGRIAAHLEAAFEGFGSSTLSPRECQIVQLILKGHSSKSIARTLNNSQETIKVHRRRIYAKLGVTSQGELLSLFLAAMSKAPPTAIGDPLGYLEPRDAISTV